MSQQARSEQKVVGNAKNFWLWTKKDGFDLTHPPTPTSAPVYPRLKVATENTQVVIAPRKTALIIIDMQNFFLYEPFRPRGPGHDAEETLLKYGLPAAREAGIQVIWLTWGCSDKDLETLSPTNVRAFGYNDDGSWDGGIGHEMGTVRLANGGTISGGKLLMRDQWNTALHGPLAKAFEEGSKQSSVPDVRFHKNRLSGMCDAMTEFTDFLKTNSFTTLLFTGINTDQCVLGTVQDANLKGFDTILLKDGCGTNTGDFAAKTTETNCNRSWGFVSSCRSLFDATEAQKSDL